MLESFSQRLSSEAGEADVAGQMASSASKWTPTLKGTAKEQSVPWEVLDKAQIPPQILLETAGETSPLVPVSVWRPTMSR